MVDIVLQGLLGWSFFVRFGFYKKKITKSKKKRNRTETS
jgi:hypothetical protein